MKSKLKPRVEKQHTMLSSWEESWVAQPERELVSQTGREALSWGTAQRQRGEIRERDWESRRTKGEHLTSLIGVPERGNRTGKGRCETFLAANKRCQCFFGQV